MAETLKDDEWVRDLSELARELGLQRQVIYDARRKWPDEAPAKHARGRRENLTAWERFCAEKLIGRDEATPALADLKGKIMQRDIELRDLKIARERGDIVSRAVVSDLLAVLGQKLDLLLRLKLEVEIGARMHGKSAAECNKEGATILDEIREIMNNNVAKFEADAIVETRREKA